MDKLQLSDLLQSRVQELAAQPAQDLEFLVREVERHTRVIEIVARSRPLPVPLARSLSAGLTELLKGLDETNDSQDRKLIQAATRYYVDKDDDDHDLVSASGLDDDAEVFIAIARAVLRPDLADSVAAHCAPKDAN